MKTREMTVPAAGARPPGLWLQVGSALLPMLKCALCPVCLGTVGSAFAGARLGFLADERRRGGLILFAVVADMAILGESARHHRHKWPLMLCCIGAVAAMFGHFGEEVAVEYVGFAALMIASVWNVVILRRHRRLAGACCAHEVHDARPAWERSQA